MYWVQSNFASPFVEGSGRILPSRVAKPLKESIFAVEGRAVANCHSCLWPRGLLHRLLARRLKTLALRLPLVVPETCFLSS